VVFVLSADAEAVSSSHQPGVRRPREQTNIKRGASAADL
jgi:hypothetical protein